MLPGVIVALAVSVGVVAGPLQTPNKPVIVTAGYGFIVNVIDPAAGAQGAPVGLLVVNVSTTEPAVLSATDGV